MEPDLSWIVGQSISEVVYRDPENWWIHFSNGGHLHTEGLWRLIADGRIRCTSYDHGHWFGLGAPVQADEHLKAFLADYTVTNARFTDCRDIFLDFGEGTRLEILFTSSGYEGWYLMLPSGAQVYGVGGGSLEMRDADWKGDSP